MSHSPANRGSVSIGAPLLSSSSFQWFPFPPPSEETPFTFVDCTTNHATDHSLLGNAPALVTVPFSCVSSLHREIRHPNICLFLGVCNEDSQIHVVTEFIGGGTLWKLLKQHQKPLTWHTRVHLSVEIAKAITFIHAKNIMHRDLKSENILVRQQTQSCSVQRFASPLSLTSPIPTSRASSLLDAGGP